MNFDGTAPTPPSQAVLIACRDQYIKTAHGDDPKWPNGALPVYTGEFREPLISEWFVIYSGTTLLCALHTINFGPRHIVRPEIPIPTNNIYEFLE